jgi:hypothetical protein
MIELILVEPGDTGIFSQMLFVATDAGGGGITEMETFPAVDLRFNLRVAGQAFRTADLAAALVTLNAICDPLQILVRPGKRTGRDLPEAGMNICRRQGYHRKKEPFHQSDLRISSDTRARVRRRCAPPESETS